MSPNGWGTVELSKNDRTVARLPYAVNKKMGLTVLSIPPLTQTLGPWLAPLTGKYATQLSQQKELMDTLIEQLPPHDYFSQRFHHSVTNWLPFYWRGFEQTTRYTYIIEALDDLEQVWSQFQGNVRNHIRKAQKQVAVRTDLDIERFLDVNALTYKRQGLKLPYSRDTVRRLDAACAKRQASRMFFAEDARGRTHAVTYLVWDKNYAYSLMGGNDPDLRSSGADSLLLWEAIRFAATVTEKFDFLGSMIKPVERFVQGFGGVQKPYFHVKRYSRRVKLLVAGRDMATTVLGTPK